MSQFFRKARKTRSKLRLGFKGQPKTGKTYGSLKVATGLSRYIRETTGNEAPIFLIDTEHESSSLYADLFDFSNYMLQDFHPDTYCRAIDIAQQEGAAILIIDSISHAWAGTGGLLEQVNEFTEASKSKNSFAAWGKGTPIQNRFINKMLACKMHLIATMRSKMEYLQTTDHNGKGTIERVGLAAGPARGDRIRIHDLRRDRPDARARDPGNPLVGRGRPQGPQG